MNNIPLDAERKTLMTTTEPDFRALCVELLGWVERQSRHHYTTLPLVERARAALEQTQKDPTNE